MFPGFWAIFYSFYLGFRLVKNGFKDDNTIFISETYVHVDASLFLSDAFLTRVAVAIC